MQSVGLVCRVVANVFCGVMYTVVTRKRQPIPKAFLDSIIPIGIICLWSGYVVPYKWSLCEWTNGTPLLPIKSINTKKENCVPTLGGTQLLLGISCTLDSQKI